MKYISRKRAIFFPALLVLLLAGFLSGCGGGSSGGSSGGSGSTDGASSSSNPTDSSTSTAPADPTQPPLPPPPDPAEPAPAAPTGLYSANTTTSSVNLYWTDNATNEQGFTIYIASNVAGPFNGITDVGENITTVLISNLNPGSTYYFRVEAYNTTSGSGFSNTVSVTTLPVATSPAAPTGFSVSNITSSSARLNWTDVADNETRYEVGNCTGLISSGGGMNFCASGFAVITTLPAGTTSYTLSGLSSSSSVKVAVRAANGVGVSAAPYLGFTTSATAPVLRIINDLYDQTAGSNLWGKWNKIVRVRIGATQSSVLNSTSTEKLWPTDTAAASNYSAITYVIDPAYRQNTNYWDFDVSTFAGGNYHVFIQNGWWEYDALFDNWTKHMTAVLNCTGAVTYKWASLSVTGHTSGMTIVYASTFLPDGHWQGSPFCP